MSGRPVWRHRKAVYQAVPNLPVSLRWTTTPRRRQAARVPQAGAARLLDAPAAGEPRARPGAHAPTRPHPPTPLASLLGDRPHSRWCAPSPSRARAAQRPPRLRRRAGAPGHRERRPGLRRVLLVKNALCGRRRLPCRPAPSFRLEETRRESFLGASQGSGSLLASPPTDRALRPLRPLLPLKAGGLPLLPLNGWRRYRVAPLITRIFPHAPAGTAPSSRSSSRSGSTPPSRR